MSLPIIGAAPRGGLLCTDYSRQLAAHALRCAIRAYRDPNQHDPIPGYQRRRAAMCAEQWRAEQ